MSAPQPADEAAAISRRVALCAAAIAAAIGFVLGAFNCPTWQVAVESAQIRAGLTDYPDSNSFHRYHLHAWSILHQILAIPLALGLSERASSILLSGVLTGTTFGAIAMIAGSLRSGVAIAVLSPLAWYTVFGSSNAYGIVYPIFSVGTHHTYGVAGRAIALWIIALLSIRTYRPALLLAGLAPAIHLTWGAFAIVVGAIALAWSRDRLRPIRDHVSWLVAGACVAAVSRLDNLWQRAGLPETDGALSREIVFAFQQHWDVHRIPANLVAPGSVLVIGSLVLAAFLYRSHRRDTEFPVVALLIASAIGAAGLVLTLLSDLLPQPLIAAMPGRFANFTLLLLPAILPALVVQSMVSDGRVRLASLGFFAYLLYPLAHLGFEQFLSSERFGWELPHWIAALALMLLIAVAQRNTCDNESTVVSKSYVSACAAALSVLWVAHAAIAPPRPTGIGFDPASEFVFEVASEAHGAIISGPAMELVQLRTRAPVLVNTGGLDQLPYVPSSATDMDRTLKLVYGVDLRQAPQDPLTPLFAGTRDLFESRTRSEWQSLQWEFPDYPSLLVLTQADWELDLPLIAESPTLRLFEIPETADAEPTL